MSHTPDTKQIDLGRVIDKIDDSWWLVCLIGIGVGEGILHCHTATLLSCFTGLALGIHAGQDTPPLDNISK